MPKKRYKKIVDIPQIVKAIGEHDGFHVGDRVKIIEEWAKGASQHYAYIRAFQVNGSLIFAKVEWAGKQSLDLEAKFGILFDTKSLKKMV